MADLFCEPSAEQRVAKSGLVGKRISLWWDGDAVFFPAKVIAFDAAANVHNVRYDNDDSNELYPEVLAKQPWKIWMGNEEDFKIYNLMKVEEARVLELLEEEREMDCRSSSSSMKMSYSVMAVEAVLALAERNGSSLVAIRKYIQANYPLKQQQIASFNSLTLKGVSKAVATNELEKLKHSYKVTSQEKEKRKERDRRANYIASGRNPRDAKRKKGGKGSKKGGRNNRSSSSVYDFYYPGSAAESNRPRRRDMERLKERRDTFLDSKKDLLLHFLNDNDYFKKKEKREKKGLEKVERKKKEDAAAALALKVLREAAEFNGDNGVNDSTYAAIVALPAENSIVLEISSESGGVAAVKSISAAEIKADTGADSVKCVSWDGGVVQNETAPSSSCSVNGEERANGNDEDEDVSTAPIELDVSYAMRGVPIVAQPPTLIAELHEHQIQGISWMAHMFTNGMPMILGDQMGLGKTIQSIGLLAHLQSALGQGGPHLVVVPLSVLSNWLSEIERFCPSMRAVRFHGPKAERNRIKCEELSDTTEFDIVVTTFEILVSEVNFFKRKYVWTTIIVDEGHRLKNEKSQLSEKLRSVSCLSKIILTGTPLQNNLRELWALLHFLAQDVFTPATAERFETGFDLVKGLVDSRLLRRARRLLGVFMLRRVKDQVAISLPSRRELTVLVPLTNRQVEWYKRLLCGLDSDVIETVMRESVAAAPTIEMEVESTVSATLTSLKQKNGKTSSSSSSEKNLGSSGDSDWRKLMNLLLQLRKICNHIYLMPDAAPEPYDVGEHVVGGSGKLLMLDRMLPRLREDGHRVLLFSQFTSMLDLLEDYCELRDLPYVRLDGETNRVQRRLDVRRFNAPKSPLFIFLISTRAGGLGLNLASADTVILYDSDWNPQVDLQAMERAHRIGQVKPVRVYRLVCSGSVEERMVSRAEKKLFLNAMVAETDAEEMDGNEVDQEEKDDENQALGIGGATMSKGELASLIRFGANAVFESAGNTQISDGDLDKLLERQGRDKAFVAPTNPVVCVASSSSSSSSSSAASSSSDKSSASASAAAAAMSTGLAMDDIEAVQAALRDRMELLTEVDLRQLGNTLYTRRKSRPKSEGIDVKNIVGAEDADDPDCDDQINNKRIRKERVVMIDGKGTGYGGAVPVLLDSMDLPAAAAPISRHRTRAWTHMPFCAFCARSKSTEANSICKCAHCPRVFHTNCMDEKGIPKGAGMFICPHHKCASCNRSTAAAGGLLFRCMGCLTSYCEDCLPQDEIESIGRCRSMEDLGYESKQSYYIMCPSCCLQDGVTAKGVVGDREIDQDADDEADDEEEENDEDDEDAGCDGEGDSEIKTVRKSPEPEVPLLPTQLMRVVWDEEPDSEEERQKKSMLLKAAKKAEKERVKKEKDDAAAAMRDKKRDAKTDSKDSAKVKQKGKIPVAGLVRSKRLSQIVEEATVSKKFNKVAVKASPAMPPSRYPVRGGVAPAAAAVPKKKAVVVQESEEDDDDDDDEEDESDSSEEEDDEYKVRIPVRCELGDALNILLSHPRSLRQGLGSMKDNLLYSSLSAAVAASSSSHPFTVTLDAIQTKLASGRYRSVVPFISDVRAFLNSFKAPKGSGGKLKSLQPSEEETVPASPPKRRRIPALPPASTVSSRLLRPPVEGETEENLQVLIDFFNDRLVDRLATL